MKAVFCPQCDEYNLFNIVVSDPPLVRTCKKCGHDLTSMATPPVVNCLNTGLICANPCHYHTVPYNLKTRRICRENTPPPQGGAPA